MAESVWVFGYGSLVAPASVERTIGRPVGRHEGFHAAWLSGFGRRWNYGSLRQRADWHGPFGPVEAGIVVSLGLVAVGGGQRCNGAVVRVSSGELALLDERESDYERIDVTDRVEVPAGPVGGRIATYVPRPSAIERYESARDARRAAIRAGYVDLVLSAFEALGADHGDQYRRSTPAPDVPVVDFP